MSNVEILKSTMPLTMALTSKEQIEMAKKMKIPMFKGKLFQLDDYGNEMFIQDNTVVLGGAITALEQLFGVAATFKPASLNSIYGVNNTMPTSNAATNVMLFGVGTGGSGIDFGSVVDPDFKQRELPDFIPFKVSDITALEGSDASKYYFRRHLTDGSYAWYLKEFEQLVTITSRRKDSTEEGVDGTEITSEIHDSTYTGLVESYGECKIKISTSDIRGYYEHTGNIEQARYNTIGLFLGQKVQIEENYYDYINTRLFSYVTFDNVSVKEKNEIVYLYRIYGML